MKYWDLETFENVTKTSGDTSGILNLAFSHEHQDLLFACSQDNIRIWNIETNNQLDVMSVPPKPVADFKLSPRMRSIFLCTLQANTLSVYFSSLDALNFDETVDTVPSSDAKTTPLQNNPKALSRSKTDDVVMK